MVKTKYRYPDETIEKVLDENDGFAGMFDTLSEAKAAVNAKRGKPTFFSITREEILTHMVEE